MRKMQPDAYPKVETKRSPELLEWVGSRFALRVVLLLFLFTMSVKPVFALPTMVRIGVICAACHVSPEDGGLLTVYGRYIDNRHSWKQVPPRQILPAFRGTRGERRWLFDTRTVLGASRPPSGASEVNTRVNARAMGLLAPHLRAYFMGGMETPLAGHTPLSTAKPVVNKAVIEYRPTGTVTLVAGQDFLPTGLGTPDLTRRLLDGQLSAPQVKAEWQPKWAEITSYFAGGENSGAGIVAGLSYRNHYIGGVTMRRTPTSQTNGCYARLGFGRWGILAEHTNTEIGGVRTREGIVQPFWAVRDWSVFSVEVDAHKHVTPIAALRLSEIITVILATRLEEGQKPTALFTLTLKTRAY